MIPGKTRKRAKLIRLLYSALATGELDFADFDDDELAKLRSYGNDQWVNFATALMTLDDAKLLHEWLKAEGGPDAVREALDEEIEERKNNPVEDDLGLGELAGKFKEVSLD